MQKMKWGEHTENIYFKWPNLAYILKVGKKMSDI